MRDYVFVALPGSPVLSLLIPTALLGLWHGAAWKYVLWGVANGLALGVYVSWRIHRRTPGGKGGGPVAIGGTLVFWAYSLLLMALFFCPDVPTALRYWRALFTHPWTTMGDPSLIALSVFLAAFLALQVLGRHTDWRSRWNAVPGWAKGVAFAVLFYVVVFFSVPVGQKFVYMQF
jgi:D-alanyl-lipoteichoic acid acyltransferase DltB (MBOAT superfamily)